MLQGRPHLYLEGDGTQRTFLQIADIVEWEVAEAVQLMLALIDGVLPVDVEDLLGDGGHLVDVIGIISDHPDTDDIGDIVECFVLIALLLQLPCQWLFRLDAAFEGVQLDVLFAQSGLEQVWCLLYQLFQLRQLLVIGFQQFCSMGALHNHTNSKRWVKPVMANTWRRLSFILATQTLLPFALATFSSARKRRRPLDEM